ncbi:MAG: N-acetyltransferase [Chloroflexaceae bacterium]|nr:N-acetyltransferase [Chloroflexaceae bacterium]
MKIRTAIAADLPTIVSIYNASIPARLATADTKPISVDSRLDWFVHHGEQRPLWVLELQEVAGWLSFQNVFNGRPAYQKTAELSIYVSPHYRRQGIGQTLLQAAIAKSPQLQLETLIALIFAHNQPSLQLFGKQGFERWGLLPQVAELDGVKRDLVIAGRRVNPTENQKDVASYIPSEFQKFDWV